MVEQLLSVLLPPLHCDFLPLLHSAIPRHASVPGALPPLPRRTQAVVRSMYIHTQSLYAHRALQASTAVFVKTVVRNCVVLIWVRWLLVVLPHSCAARGCVGRSGMHTFLQAVSTSAPCGDLGVRIAPSVRHAHSSPGITTILQVLIGR